VEIQQTRGNQEIRVLPFYFLLLPFALISSDRVTLKSRSDLINTGASAGPREKEFVMIRVVSWIALVVIAKATVHEITRNDTKANLDFLEEPDPGDSPVAIKLDPLDAEFSGRQPHVPTLVCLIAVQTAAGQPLAVYIFAFFN
jgi:hypothetical protein